MVELHKLEGQFPGISSGDHDAILACINESVPGAVVYRYRETRDFVAGLIRMLPPVKRRVWRRLVAHMWSR